MDNFTSYGPTFQIKVISALLSDRRFFQTIADILQPDMFDSQSNIFLVQTIRTYFYEYKALPTLEVLKIKINELDNEILKISVIENLKTAWKNINAEDLQFIKDEALKFCKNQKMKAAIIQSVDLLELKNYDQIKHIIDDAMRAGEARDLGHDYIPGLEERLLESSRATIATPWDPINEILDGGLGAGDEGIIVAPAGIGKSWMLQAIGAWAVKLGKTVIHYTLELKQNYVGLRYDTIFSKITTANIKYYQDEVDKIIKQLSGQLRIKYYPTKSASVQTLFSHLKQLELQEIVPDMIIVDYADLLQYSELNAKDLRTDEILGQIYTGLRGMAGEFDVPLWTASQANRSSLEDDIIQAGKIAASYEKLMVADFVMSIQRRVADKIANTARCHVIKNRYGRDGITFPMKMDTNTGTMEIYNETSLDGKAQQGKMNNSEEYLRKQLSSRYQAMKQDEKTVEGFE